MNLRQLEHFVAVLDHGSYSAAAKVVNLSQPALSRSISTLEDLLGVPLFDRQGHKPSPTPYALVYAERARGMLMANREAKRCMTLMHSGTLGPLSMGMTSAPAELLMPAVLTELLRNGTGLKLRTSVGNSLQLLEKLQSEEIDFFVGDVDVVVNSEAITVESLYRAGFGWYARKMHPLAGRSNLNIDDARQFPLVAGYGRKTLARQIEKLYKLSAPFESHLSVITDDLGTMRQLIQSSDVVVPGISFALTQLRKSGQVVALDVKPRLDVFIELGIIHLAGRTLVPAATRAFEIIRLFFEQAVNDDRILSMSSSSAASPRKAKSLSA
jgi:DNA-binding transcriptional LysR family regulator